jgi:hypothetical protein
MISVQEILMPDDDLLIQDAIDRGSNVPTIHCHQT